MEFLKNIRKDEKNAAAGENPKNHETT